MIEVPNTPFSAPYTKVITVACILMIDNVITRQYILLLLILKNVKGLRLTVSKQTN